MRTKEYGYNGIQWIHIIMASVFLICFRDKNAIIMKKRGKIIMLLTVWVQEDFSAERSAIVPCQRRESNSVRALNLCPIRRIHVWAHQQHNGWVIDLIPSLKYRLLCI